MSVSEALSREVLSLPIYPELLLADVERVIEIANKFHANTVIP
jgi:dTDP-4-amino-4,6-dideoxygalactose transaminase